MRSGTGRLLAVVVTAALALALCAGRASAQGLQGLDAQTFAPPPGRLASVSIADPDSGPLGTIVVGAGLGYARWPLVRTARCDLGQTIPDVSCLRDGGRTPIVSDLASLELGFAASLWSGLQLGLVAPVSYARVADSVARPTRLEDELVPGDVRLSAGLPLLSGNTGLMLALAASLPTGDEQRLLGSHGPTLMPHLIVRQRLGRAAIAAQLGYRARQQSVVLGLELDDELEGMLGLSLPLLASLDLRAELRGRLGVMGEGSRGRDPVEATLAAAFGPRSPISVVLGAGAGLWPGRDGYGAPVVRVVGLLRYAWQAGCGDGEGEQREQREQPCAGAGADADGDGIADGRDLCVELAEDEDGFFDGDGCPDRDDDADGFPDQTDACPRASEDRDGVQDDDGCPEPDDDADGVADGLDGCAMDPEDRDAFEDEDGCPEPGPGVPTVSVGPERIVVSEPILYDYDHDALREASGKVVDALAAALRDLPPGVRVLIEVYVDASGNAVYDLDLTSRRAAALAQALHERGVPAERLEHAGRGAATPYAAGRTPRERASDRRVELTLRR